MARYESRASRVFAAPRDVLWAIVADTNRMNRAVGNVPGSYDWREVDGERQRVARGNDLGQALEWVELPYQWVEGEFMESRRRFIVGPVDAAFFDVHLRDVSGGTECDLRMGFEGQGAVLAALGWVVRLRHRRALRRALDAVAVAVGTGEPRGDAQEPAAVRAQRLLTGGYDEVTSGPRTPADEAALATALRRLGGAQVDPALGARIGEWIARRPDEEVAQMRPFEIARTWGADRRETLRAFLHATRAGLVDMRWQINCPVCRVSAQVAESLDQVGSKLHCAACNVSYAVDFGRYVEAVFQPNPEVRQVTPALFCASSPTWRPHVFAQVTLPPGGQRSVSADLPLGELHARTLAAPHTDDCTLGARPRALAVEVSDHALRVTPEGRSDDGRTELRMTSTATAPRTLLLERSGWSADQVLGSVVASFPDFLDLFATEAPATGVELAVGRLAVLFSDLTGSTALYERVGDARAFALVEEHFTIAEKAIVDCAGAIVKTMGDAVMATFPSAAEAVRAAVQMVRANDRVQGPHGLAVKVGVHSGACLAVRANERLDFFGRTVNIAARLQAQAHAGELVLTEEMAAEPPLVEALAGLPRRAFEAHLKGIGELQRLVAFDCSEPDGTGGRSS